MERITGSDLVDMFKYVEKVMEKNTTILCEMDAKMGDGDLGLTMKKGFGALPGILSEINEQDIGTRLIKAGLKMSAVAPSTMGTLMASGIVEGGKAVAGMTELDAVGFSKYLKGFSDGISKRGKCARGDRTVLDVVAPAAERAQISSTGGATLKVTAQQALAGAEEGLAKTKGMLPKFGKAAVFQGNAIGTEDQGAYAGRLMILGYCEFICR